MASSPLSDIPPAGARLKRERDILTAGEPCQPGLIKATAIRVLPAIDGPTSSTGRPDTISAGIASELRSGADYVRVPIALTVVTRDLADALAIAWDAFRSAARDDLTG